MKKIAITSLFSLFLILLVSLYNPALSQITAADEEKEIRANILKLLTSAVKNFTDTKGELLKTNDDGSKLFLVLGMESMKASSQYIEVRKDGTTRYVATWTGDAKKIVTSFKAFYSLHDEEKGNIIEQDKQASIDNKRVYYLTIEDMLGEQMARFIADGKINKGELVIKFLGSF